MKAKDIPYDPKWQRSILPFRKLLETSNSNRRETWEFLPAVPGIYVVYWTLSEPPSFSDSAGNAKNASPIRSRCLQAKWKNINQLETTDVIYIGKGNDLRRRTRDLARFGVGKSRSHRGGEWMWQILEISTTNILVQGCPQGQQVAFENWLLELFCQQHGNWPIANRDGPINSARWWPERE